MNCERKMQKIREKIRDTKENRFTKERIFSGARVLFKNCKDASVNKK